MTPGYIRQRKSRARQYAAGKHYVRGKLVDTPRVRPSQRSTFPPDEVLLQPTGEHIDTAAGRLYEYREVES